MNINLSILKCKAQIQQIFHDESIPISVIVLILSEMIEKYKNVENEYLEMLLQEEAKKEEKVEDEKEDE